jgi:hypothetical protein
MSVTSTSRTMPPPIPVVMPSISEVDMSENREERGSTSSEPAGVQSVRQELQSCRRDPDCETGVVGLHEQVEI